MSKDWAKTKAIELIDKYWDSSNKAILKVKIEKALQDAAAIEWPTTEECMSQCFKDKAQTEEQSYESGYLDAIIWIKSYIRASRTVSKNVPI